MYNHMVKSSEGKHLFSISVEGSSDKGKPVPLLLLLCKNLQGFTSSYCALSFKLVE